MRTTRTSLTTAQTQGFLPYMRDVVRCEQSLQDLNLMWRIIESSAKMNCPTEARAILPTMAATRVSFSQLEHELVANLVAEKVRNVLTEIGTRAQYVIDIVVRNLYERTADVGFLATDRELCGFVADPGRNQPDAVQRLRAYRDKYTVYDEILLLDTTGRVLAQIDPAAPIAHSADPLVRQTLASDDYVETFRASDLRPSKGKALVYSRRMHHPDTGAVVGLLCLCFHFEQEMAGIFDSHGDPGGSANLLLLDGNQCVIASANEMWMPVGTRVPANPDGAPGALMWCGRQYLVRSFTSAGYQGYPGPPGWTGQVMVPVDAAFGHLDRDLITGLDPALVEGLLSHAQSFCPPLHDIMIAARHIQRIVWNGQVMTAGQSGDMLKLKTVLDQISETGNRSNELFAQSIHDLYQTVLGSSLLDTELTAHLLVDLLDRNLYERSDDCRWWALTPELRQALAAPTAGSQARMAQVLGYINGLYTVYTRIFVYDASGTIVASTGSETEAVVGTQLDADTLACVKALRSPQHYHVPPFGPSRLYEGAATCVYHAAIRHPQAEARVVGGIGLVFDAGPELLNMLRSGLGGRDAMSALFVDRQGRVLAGTSAEHPAGARIGLAPALLRLANGCRASQLTTHAGQYAIVACAVSSGYREFKRSDGHVDDVVAVVFRHFGAVRQARVQHGAQRFAIASDPTRQGGPEFATFFLDGALMALPAECVQEAVSFAEVRPTAMGGRTGQIGLPARTADAGRHAGARVIWVFDLGRLLKGRRSTLTSNSQVLILRLRAHTVGLLVDDLHAVAQFDTDAILSAPLGSGGESGLIASVIKANAGELLIQSLSVERLFAWLVDGVEPAGAPAQDAVAALS